MTWWVRLIYKYSLMGLVGNHWRPIQMVPKQVDVSGLSINQTVCQFVGWLHHTHVTWRQSEFVAIAIQCKYQTVKNAWDAHHYALCTINDVHHQLANQSINQTTKQTNLSIDRYIAESGLLVYCNTSQTSQRCKINAKYGSTLWFRNEAIEWQHWFLICLFTSVSQSNKFYPTFYPARWHTF